MLPVTLVHQVPGGAPVELTPVAQSVSFDTAAVGGFGSLECQIVGDVRRKLGYLGLTQLFHGSSLLWEGQLEDVPLTVGGSEVRTTVRAFGLRRLLEEVSTRRIWSKRNIDWAEDTSIAGVGDGTNSLIRTPSQYNVQTGAFDPTDLTHAGVRVIGVDGGGTAVAGHCNGAIAKLPPGLSLVRVMYDVVNGNGSHEAILEYSTDGSAWTQGDLQLSVAGTQNKSVAVSAGTRFIRLIGGANAGAFTISSAFRVDFQNIRFLGTTITEDAAGGFYGGTILRDLVALAPGLTIGLIEDGTDYLIQAIERSARDTLLSVVNEVVGYYTREWAVWEEGRFDWKTRNLDEPQVVIPVAQFTELELDSTLDGVAGTVYVLYTDAASGLDAEASAASTDQRNPYVRQARTKDVTVQAGFPMTANTSGQLAARIVGDIGARPSVSGRCTLPATALVTNLVGAARPAALIRAGENILIPDLPKTDPFLTGRDGETLFHIASSQVDLSSNTVTLELEGQQSRADVILARLAASTRVLTG